jgi:methylated-DNA-[protein]-cysteine S-methyltransferase
MTSSTHSPTPFQRRVYAATRRVPAGRVTTYKLLGAAVGCRSSRAIGQALRQNPFAPVVPCHRVIQSDLTIGGFSGKTAGREVSRKKALLAREGVRFGGNRLLDPEQVFAFPAGPRRRSR